MVGAVWSLCHRDRLVREQRYLMGTVPFPLFYCPQKMKNLKFEGKG